VLKAQQAQHIIVAHTPFPAILPRFAGKVITLDVGLSSPFKGPPAFLIVEGTRFYVMHRGKRIVLPVDGRGAQYQREVLDYLREVLAADPKNSQVRKLIAGNAR
jgi:hypothetical protein